MERADPGRLRRDRALGEGEQPAGDAADGTGNGKGEPVHALDVDADRLRAQRRVAPGPHGIAERREQEAAQQQHADDRQRQRQQIEGRAAVERCRGQTPRMPLEPPVTPSHWNTIDQTICAKASVSMAR